MAAVKLADRYCRKCFHLIITCNPDKDLARYAIRNNSYEFILPPQANDKSLEMTGSYSGLVLAALLMADIHQIKCREATVKTLVTIW